MKNISYVLNKEDNHMANIWEVQKNIVKSFPLTPVSVTKFLSLAVTVTISYTKGKLQYIESTSNL